MEREGPGGSHYFGRAPDGVEAETAPASAPVAAREPLTRAPWPALLLAASILLVFAWQSASGGVEAWNERFGLRPAEALEGRDLFTALTAMWSHAGWGHAGLNAVFCLAFGAPVARLFGTDAKGAAAFGGFYLLTGLLASLAFVLLHREDDVVLVGASGAVSGLTGAAARLISLPRAGEGAGRGLASFRDPTLLVMSAAYLGGNLALGLLGVDVGQGDAPLAWEAHIAGYLAGLLLVGPAAALLARRPPPA